MKTSRDGYRKPTVEFVKLGDLSVPDEAQRKLNQSKVNALAADFDPELIGTPIVSRRENGTCMLIDGQHRVSSLKLWLGDGWESQQIRCAVFHELSSQQEADLFLKFNNTLTVRTFDKFRIACNAKWPDQVEVERVVQAQGLHISDNKVEGGVGCVAALMAVYERGGSDALARDLRIIRDAFGDVGMSANVVSGIGLVTSRFNGQLDEQHCKARLTRLRGGVQGLMNRARQLRMQTGRPVSQCVAAATVETYNSGRGGRRLPNWWTESE